MLVILKSWSVKTVKHVQSPSGKGKITSKFHPLPQAVQKLLLPHLLALTTHLYAPFYLPIKCGHHVFEGPQTCSKELILGNLV
jgi:hypothetical protein